MLAATEIQNMSLTERLKALELLWDSIASTPDQVESPTWHKAILSERLKKVDSGKSKFLTLHELKDRLSKKRG
jgi:putative addiction module component (TIGR02574 family)